ncbi:MAG TPA: SHOCT domain-containing protein [Spirochaetia bacterium]|nr:SHOCT domain-containing protein [Spirochaetia bacterium]
MWHWGWGWGRGVFPFFLLGAGFRLAVLGAVVAAVVYLVRGISRRGGTGGRESAREILERRYANGEISKEQFEEMKRTLG